MAPILRSVLLFASILSLSLAIPTTEQQEFLQYGPLSSRQSPTKTRFQRLRDSLIERIWSVPQKTICSTSRGRSDYAAPANFRTKYGNDAVLRFNITTEDEAKAFSEAAGILYLDIWEFTDGWIDVRITKTMLPSLLNLLPSSMQNSHTPLMHDLAQAVYDTYPASTNSQPWRVRHQQHQSFFSQYQPLSVIYPWIDLIAAFFPDVFTTFSIGNSAEGRDIQAIRVGAPLSEQFPDTEVNARQTILVVGGSHAREWISVSTTAYLAYTFAEQYGQPRSHQITQLLKHYDFVFIPVLNPDGYEYSWGTDRLWRKTRQATAFPFCPGIDLDRAYSFEWDGQGEVDNPCTENYAGEYPFDAVEAKVLTDWVFNQTRDGNVVFSTFIDLHSYSQKILYPYSYSCDFKPTNLEDLEEIAFGFAKSFFLSSWHLYQVSPACENQFSFTTMKDGEKVRQRVDGTNSNGGSPLDYFFEVMRVKYAYQIKLRDTGTYGFLLPKEDILPSGKETFEAMLNFGHWLLSNRGIELAEDDQEVIAEHSEDASANDEWINRSSEYSYFQSEGSGVDEDVNGINDDDDEWERVFDEELRRRRR